MAGDRVPISTWLSQVLVAHNIEFDDLAEQRVFHGTTVGGHGAISAGGVWFTSRVMWTNFIRSTSTVGPRERFGLSHVCPRTPSSRGSTTSSGGRM